MSEAENSILSGLDAKWAERDRLREAAQETLRRKEAARTPAERLESLRGSGVVTAPDGQPSIVVPDGRDVEWAVKALEDAVSHLRYIRTNREWGKSVRYPELDEFLERFDA